MKILAIETSCDETAAAIVEDGVKIITNVVASSHLTHRKYGGIVPEVAARKQVEYMPIILKEALEGHTKDDIDAIAVTHGPGLIGPLLVGVETAKTLAFAWNKPIIPVNHVLAHIYANFIKHSSIAFPAIALVVSGGHTELYLMNDIKTLKWLGGTLDDAAGEAFDKTARLLGFENRGGIAIQESASKFKVGSSKFAVKLPRPLLRDETFNFSFSGLKTAVMREWNKFDHEQQTTNQELISVFAHEIQEAITDVLVSKTIKAAEKYKAKSILLSGGVSANKKLREKFSVHSKQFTVVAPPTELCTDNAAAIAAYAHFRGEKTDWKNIEAKPDLSVEIIDALPQVK